MWHLLTFHKDFITNFVLTVIEADLTDKLWTDYERCAEKSIDDDNDHKF